MPNTTLLKSVKLDEGTVARIHQLSLAKNRSAHWIMKEAINAYVEKEEQLQQLNQDCIEAWERFQGDGLHVRADEVLTWLDTWGENDVMPAPQCHK